MLHNYLYITIHIFKYWLYIGDNFDDHIKESVDSGKTLFIKWIASEGWGWWRKQAPTWNQVIRRFVSNDKLAFADVNLSKDRVGGSHSPGAGGWPTIKYFNKATGYEGASYVKKTNKAICDELGNEEGMLAYIMDASNMNPDEL